MIAHVEVLRVNVPLEVPLNSLNILCYFTDKEKIVKKTKLLLPVPVYHLLP